jgi:hypothetical protein
MCLSQNILLSPPRGPVPIPSGVAGGAKDLPGKPSGRPNSLMADAASVARLVHLDDQPQTNSLDLHTPAQNWMPLLPNAV